MSPSQSRVLVLFARVIMEMELSQEGPHAFYPFFHWDSAEDGLVAGV